MTDTTNPYFCLPLSKIFVEAFQAGFSMEIIKEVDSVKCVQDINMLISYNVSTLGINNWKTATLAQKQSTWWNCKGQAVHSSVRLCQKHSCRFDSTSSMFLHVNSVSKSAFYHLCNISRIRKLLSSKTTEILVHAFVSSKLDYCNSLLYNVPKYVLKKLQSVQNVAAHLITCSRKYDHIAPVLSDLHWLPVNEHIKFKILLLTFKAVHQQAPIYIQNLVTRY